MEDSVFVAWHIINYYYEIYFGCTTGIFISNHTTQCSKPKG